VRSFCRSEEAAVDRVHQSREGVDPWGAAQRLAHDIATGGELPCVASPALVDLGEVAHVELEAFGWRFEDVDVVHEQRSVLAAGGPLLFGLAVAATRVANRRAREVAVRHAAPQWRPLGQLRVVATDRRLLVLHRGAWASVWLSAVRQLCPVLEAQRLELVFEDDPPYALAGPWVPYLTVVLTTVLARQRGPEAVAAAVVPA
jgi:hypothetical protein